MIVPADEIDERLVVHLELLGGERRAQVDLELAARLRLRVHLRLEEAEGRRCRRPWRGRAPGRRCLQQLVGVIAVGRARAAMPMLAPTVDQMTVDVVGLADRPRSAAAPVRAQLLRRLHVRHQRRRTRRRRAGPPYRPRAATRSMRSATSCSSRSPIGMAERVVDQLEVVEIDAQRADEAAGARCAAPGPRPCADGTARGWAGRSARRGAPCGRCAPRRACAR